MSQHISVRIPCNDLGKSKADILVATDVAARGIDIPRSSTCNQL